MAVVMSGGQLALTGPGIVPAGLAPLARSDGMDTWEATELWRRQPQVRTVVGFLARMVAGVGLHTFRRVSDLDRQRLTDHPLPRLLAAPFPRLTPYRLKERLVSDLGIYDRAYWLKLRDPSTRAVTGLVPVPPTLIYPSAGTWLAPDEYETIGGNKVPVEDVVDIHGYDPCDLRVGATPLYALRSLLMEAWEASEARGQMWQHGARPSGVLQRPAEAPEWSDKARTRFREDWARFTTSGGAAGGTPILEDGMTYTTVSMTPEDAQYIEARKLTREEVAAAYFIPPPLIGILDHATYSNIKEQHAHLYQDTLGSWLEMIQQDIEAQLLPDFPDTDDVYVEFNIAAKMRGSFEEQAAAASTATGGPWMTRNEIRARNNLPQIEGGNELIVPMNVTEGGLASPRDTAPDAAAAPKALAGRKDALQPRTKADGGRPDGLGSFGDERDGFAAALETWVTRAGEEMVARLAVAAGAAPPSLLTWSEDANARRAELADVIRPWLYRLAQVGAWSVLDEWNPGADGWSADVMEAWLSVAAVTHAGQLEQSGTTHAAEALTRAAAGDGDYTAALKGAASAWVSAGHLRAVTAGTEARSFGSHDAASASGLEKKIWRTGGKNPRPSHVAQNGETVDLDDVFSNGLRWPGDGQGDAKETAHCNCSLDYAREG